MFYQLLAPFDILLLLLKDIIDLNLIKLLKQRMLIFKSGEFKNMNIVYLNTLKKIRQKIIINTEQRSHISAQKSPGSLVASLTPP